VTVDDGRIDSLGGVDWATTLEVADVIAGMAPGSRIADCGCHGWRLWPACTAGGHSLLGFDRVEPAGRPAAAAFIPMQGSRLHAADDLVDLAVANHVLEHLVDPLEFFAEMARITAPGGGIWIEAPSELATLQAAVADPRDHAFESFWDDPTHVRPYTPAALYRLALACRCRPVYCGRGVAGTIPVARLLARKPPDVSGRPPLAFVSLRDVPPGVDAAWNSIWRPGNRG